MQIPKDRLKFSPTCQGRESAAGYLVVSLRALDLDGINELWVDLAALEELRKQKTDQAKLADEVRALFGKPADE